MQALQTGSVDMTEYIPWQYIKTLEKDPNVRVLVGHDTFNVIRLNPKRPPFDNVKVRQALQLPDRPQGDHRSGLGRPEPAHGGGPDPRGPLGVSRRL